MAAELASGWPGEGGVYEWVKDAFGAWFGFTAAWIQWFQMTIGFISILAFIAAVPERCAHSRSVLSCAPEDN